MLELIIALLSGAAGGNIVGALAKNLSLGTLGNSLAGIVGGGAGSAILGMLAGAGMPEVADAAAGATAGGLDLGAIIGQVAGGGVGGGLLMAIVGMLKKSMAK
ncbi:MAG: hypothetical protein KDK26_09700 [Roseivivax sp.]|nr:hypothetical protein [Roseivivax sp.]